MDYLKLPLNFSAALKGQMERCTYEESIAQHIMMLIVTHYGEMEGKNDYGSVIWDLEYNQMVINNDWEEKVSKSLEKTITDYERRLKDIHVQIALTEVEEEIRNKFSNARRRVKINIKGTLISNGKSFHFGTYLYISPISQ
ncbi:MAG: GPW/gp25 family protein [Prevotella sp.]|nr:GPW/gp25 family protein [Prevotella sp.]